MSRNRRGLRARRFLFASLYNYQLTRKRLLKAISDNGLVLFGEFDHAKAAHNVGLTMPPPPFWYLVILKGEPL